MSRSLDSLAGLILGTSKKLSANIVDGVRKQFERLGFLIFDLTSHHQITLEYAARPGHQRVMHFRLASPVSSQVKKQDWMTSHFKESSLWVLSSAARSPRRMAMCQLTLFFTSGRSAAPWLPATREGVGLIAAQQGVGLSHVVRIARRALDGMHQA